MQLVIQGKMLSIFVDGIIEGDSMRRHLAIVSFFLCMVHCATNKTQLFVEKYVLEQGIDKANRASGLRSTVKIKYVTRRHFQSLTDDGNDGNFLKQCRD